MNLEILKHPDKFVKRISNYRVTFLLNPRIITSSDFVYPWCSFVLYDEDETNELPNKDLAAFHNVEDTWIFNILDTSEDIKLEDDDCRIKSASPASLIKKYISKKKKDYEVFLPGKHIRWSDSMFIHNPLIISYNLYSEAHICRDNYKSKMKKEINKFYSKIELIHKLETNNIYFNKIDKLTLKELIRTKEKYIDKKNKVGLYFLYIKLPTTLPPFNVYWNYKDKILDTGLLKYMTSQDRIQLFMLFKILASAGDNTEYDIFNYINNLELSKIHIVFELDNKITTTPLYFLLSLIKGIDIPPFLNLKSIKYDKKIILKTLYKHLLQMYQTPSSSLPDILNNSFIEKQGLVGITKESVSDDKLDDFNLNELDKDSDLNNDNIDLDNVDVESESGDILEEVNDAESIKETDLIKIDRKDTDLIKDLEVVRDGIENMKHKALKKKANKALKELKELPEKEITINGKKGKLKDFLKIDEKDIELTDDEIMLPDTKVIFDKDYLKNPINTYDEKYIQKVHHKDTVRNIVSLTRAGFIPKKIESTREESVLGDSDVYNVELVDLTGKTHKINYKVPVIKEDGTFQISGNTYRSRKTRMDIPIKKLTWNRVMLSSAYGKIFVEKAPLKKYDIGYKIKKELTKLTEEKVFKNTVFGSVLIHDVEYPTEYSLLGRYTKSFFYKNYFFMFDYANRKSIAYDTGLTEKDLEKYEKDGSIFIGYTNKKQPMFINKDNELFFVDKNKINKMDSLLEFININPSSFGFEYALVKIVKKHVPVAILLIYYMGLKNLAKALNVEYTITDKAVKEDKVISLKFLDKYLNVKLDTPLKVMVIGSLVEYKKEFKKILLETLEDNTALTSFLTDLGYNINNITEIKTLGSLFVDPVTGNILESMKEPTTFTGLLVRASEMLLNDNFGHPSDTNGYLFRGYDKIHTLTYKLMTDAIKKKMGEDYFSSGKVSINPWEVEKQLNGDSTSVLIDDLNPVAFVKQKEDTTYLGIGGRKKESMSKGTRVFHENDTGVISEAVKDSGDVGITAYMSASPLIKNLRGAKDKSKSPKFVNMLSTPGMLMPFSTHDDGKRANFTQIQMAHLVPIKDSIVFPVRTGYDTLLAYKLPKKYVGFVKEDGKVTSVSNSEVVVTYKDGKKDKFPLKSWYSKEESFSTFKFDLVANVKKGDTVKKGQVVTYCKQWFEPDMFDETRVTFKQGIIVKTVIQEIMETYEDSCSISSKLTDVVSINPVKARSIVITKDDRIANPLSIGDEVSPSSILLTILGEIEGIGDKQLTKEELELLQNFVRETPKAKYEGKIVNVKIFYNCKKNELNSTIKRLVSKVGDEILDMDSGKVFTGEVNSSYSIKGRPLQEGEVEIKYYIQTDDKPTTGDKFVFGNQLKTTIGEVFDYPIKAENGEEIEALFSSKSIIARIVTSYMINTTTTSLLRKLTDDVVNMYFK